MYDIIASIVAFKNDEVVLRKVIDSFLRTDLKVNLFVIDNSPTDDLRDICDRENVQYIFNNNNLGFGAAQNLIIDKASGKSKYHLILNPDVYFPPGTLEKIFTFMETNVDIGCLMPKVLSPEGEVQYLCRLLPSPLNLLLRRFGAKTIKGFLWEINFKYEMKFSNYEKIMDVPYLSGAFMFIRSEALAKVGKFDSRFFMYMEDVDLSRRINKYFRNVYFPDVFIHHEYAKGSYKNPVLLKYHISSAIKYFNKWGWFFDKERSSINKRTLEKLDFFNRQPFSLN